MQMVILASGHI